MGRLEIYGLALLVVAAIVTGAEFHGRHVGREQSDEKHERAALKQARESAEKEKAERDKLLERSTNYEQQIAQIKLDSANRPARVVRLCDATAASGSVPGAATPAGEPFAEAPNGSGGTPGRDIGRQLYDYADDFKACAIRVNTLIDSWPK